MAIINKQKTLNDIEALAANTSANILVLDKNSALKKLALIDENGLINTNLINIQAVENKITELNAVISNLSSTLKTLSDKVFELQSQVDAYDNTFITIDKSIKKLSEIRPLHPTAEITEDDKPAEEPVKKTVKKPRKTTKKTSAAE